MLAVGRIPTVMLMDPVFRGTPRFLLLASLLLMPATFVRATSNYEYGKDEYVTVNTGISPNGELAITAHGNGELGDEDFHLYLTDATTGKNLGALKEVEETLDTGADAFAAKWSKDSQQVAIVYRVDRRELKAVVYRVADGQARCLKPPFEVAEKDEIAKYWQTHTSNPSPSPKIFGTSLKHD